MPRARPTWLFGLIAVAMGLVIVGLAWFDPAPSRRTGLFRDYHHWQVYGFGLMFMLAGILVAMPPAWRSAQRAVGTLFLFDLLITATGTIWFASGNRQNQPGGSMTPFLNDIAAWFAGFGIHPVLGAFAVGVLVTLLVRLHRTGTSAAPTVEMTIKRSAASGQIVAPDGKAVPIPPQVLDDARSGNKIAAIKGLREAMPMDLVEAKRIVELIAER